MNTLLRQSALAPGLRLMAILWLWVADAGAAGVSLDPIFTDNMVLQQSHPGLDGPSIRGRADKGEKIWVEFQKHKDSTSPARDGTWKLELTKLNPNLPPSNLVIRSGKKGETVHFTKTNVVVGEVWVLGVGEPASVDFNPIRLERFVQTIQDGSGQRFRFLLGLKGAAGPAGAVAWQVAEPGDCRPEVRRFSNHAAYLAQAILEKKIGYVGIIEVPSNIVASASGKLILARSDASIERGFFVNTALDRWQAVLDANEARNAYFSNVVNLKRVGKVTDTLPPPPQIAPQFYSPERPAGLKKLEGFAIRGCMW